jgi:hypothetical protein
MRTEIEDLPEDVKRECERVILNDPNTEYAYKMRVEVKDLPDETKRQCERVVLKSPSLAYRLRRDARVSYGLSEEMKRELERVALTKSDDELWVD